MHKTGVINDPLGQPTVPAGSDCRWILKFCAGRTYRRTDGRTDNMCENSDHYRPGLWSASWINNEKSNVHCTYCLTCCKKILTVLETRKPGFLKLFLSTGKHWSFLIFSTGVAECYLFLIIAPL